MGEAPGGHPCSAQQAGGVLQFRRAVCGEALEGQRMDVIWRLWLCSALCQGSVKAVKATQLVE